MNHGRRHFLSLTVSLLMASGLAFAAGRSVAAVTELAVQSNFDNGNAEVRSIDQDARVVTIPPRRIRGCRNIWWHLRITGIESGETVELRVVDFDPVAGEIHPVYSYDRVTWHRMDDEPSPHRQRFTE